MRPARAREYNLEFRSTGSRKKVIVGGNHEEKEEKESWSNIGEVFA